MSMPRLCASTRQRGTFLTMTLSVMKDEGEIYEEIKTRHFNICGLVEVAGKVKFDCRSVHLYIGFKKNKIAKDYSIAIDISCEGNNKQLVCQNEWVEAPIKDNRYAGQKYIARDGHELYLIIVDISLHVTPILNSCVHQNIQNLYKDTEFDDCKLHAEDGSVAVHKSILLSHGEFFRTMLKGDWKETKEGSINMAGATVQTLKHLKAYMYMGTLPEEGLEELLLIAKRCLMDNLATECITKIIKLVKPDAFDSLLEFACQNNMFNLVKAFLRLPDDKITQIEELDIQKKLPTSINPDKKE